LKKRSGCTTSDDWKKGERIQRRQEGEEAIRPTKGSEGERNLVLLSGGREKKPQRIQKRNHNNRKKKRNYYKLYMKKREGGVREWMGFFYLFKTGRT